MHQRDQPARLIGAQPQMLDRARTIAVRGEHLGARQHQLDRPADDPRRHRGQVRMRPGIALAAEAAADKGADRPHLLGLQPEQLGERFLGSRDCLGRGVDGEPLGVAVALPQRDRRMRLHRIVVFDRCRIDSIEPHLCRGKARLGIAATAVGRPLAVAEVLRRVGGAERVLHAGLRLGLAVRDLHQLGGVLRPLQRVGDYHRDVLAVVVDQPVLQQRLGDHRPVGLALRKARRVVRGDDGQHAGRCLRRS